MIANSWVLTTARQNYLKPFVRLIIQQFSVFLKKVLRRRTNVHFLVFHLTLADVVTCFITLPMETAWRITVGVSVIRVFIVINISNISKRNHSKNYY